MYSSGKTSIPTPWGPWVLNQTEAHLLFMYWPVDPAVIRPMVPEPLQLDLFDDQAWIGQIPFHMEKIHLRWLPPIPGVDQFLEIDFFVLVHLDGQPALHFLSLEANMGFGYSMANGWYGLPYKKAKMNLEIDGDWTTYTSKRDEGSAEFAARYRPRGKPFEAQPGTLEHFLVDRYVFFSTKPNGNIYRGVVHHKPWQIQEVELHVEANTIPAAAGVPGPGDKMVTYFTRGRETHAWPPRRYTPES